MPDLRAAQARLLYKAGLTRPEDLARADEVIVARAITVRSNRAAFSKNANVARVLAMNCGSGCSAMAFRTARKLVAGKEETPTSGDAVLASA